MTNKPELAPMTFEEWIIKHHASRLHALLDWNDPAVTERREIWNAAQQEQRGLMQEALSVFREIAPHMLSYCNGHQVPPGSLSDELHMISDIVTKLQAALGEV